MSSSFDFLVVPFGRAVVAPGVRFNVPGFVVVGIAAVTPGVELADAAGSGGRAVSVGGAGGAADAGADATVVGGGGAAVTGGSSALGLRKTATATTTMRTTTTATAPASTKAGGFFRTGAWTP